MNDDEFEWDDAKAKANFAKHGVTFEVAQKAFDDAFAILSEDRRGDYGEERIILLGMVGNKLFSVAYTLRGETIRIISAREAEPYERRKYHEENSA
jgi:hypothetical protein